MDASDVGAGAVLQQEDDHGIDHSINYSRKFEDTQRRYHIIKKETLALLLGLKHFDMYLNTAVEPILVYTDHHLIVFVNKMKEKNQHLSQ